MARGGIAADRWRCEWLPNPVGIDLLAPPLSWVRASQERAQKQTAWQILVSSSAAELQTESGDLWDSGKVESGENVFAAEL